MKISRLLRWSARASSRGWYGLSGALLDLDLFFSGYSGAIRRIVNEQAARRKQPPANTLISFAGWL